MYIHLCISLLFPIMDVTQQFLDQTASLVLPISNFQAKAYIPPHQDGVAKNIPAYAREANTPSRIFEIIPPCLQTGAS